MKGSRGIIAVLMACLLLIGCSDGSADFRLEGADPEAPVISDGGRAIAQGGHVYYLNGDNYVRKDKLRLHPYRGAICRMDSDGSNKAVLCNDDVSIFNLEGDTIWYVAWDNNVSRVYTIKTDGSGRRKLADIDSTFDGGGYGFSKNYIYYTYNGALYRMDRDGANKLKLTENRICNLLCCDSGVYFTDYNSGQYGALMHVRHGATVAETVTEESSYALGAVGNAVYYYRFENGFCYSYDAVSGTSASVTHLGYEDYCFTDRGKIYASYISEEKEQGIFSIDIASGTREMLCDHRAERMLYHDGFVYYINDSALYSLWRVNVDTKETEQVADNMISSIDLLDIVGDWLYYFNDDDESRIYRVNINTLRSFCIEYEDMSIG